MLLGKSCLDERLVPKSTLSCLNDDERQLILSFVLGDLTCYPRVAAIDSRFFLACTSLGSWQECVIEIPRKWATKEECVEQLLKLSSRWRLAQKAVLPPFPQRQRLQDQLAKECPRLVLAASGEGPYLLFVMGCNLAIGSRMSLHFFDWTPNNNGTYDVYIRAEATFTLTEVWHEDLPHSSPLALGFIEITSRAPPSQGGGSQGQQAVSSPLPGPS
ncbi:unnamed protein product, partial [Symbiodinium pilosum]